MVADAGHDIALNVGFDDGTDAWFEPSVVAIVDVGAGQTAEIGGKRFVRMPAGEWVEAPDAD